MKLLSVDSTFGSALQQFLHNEQEAERARSIEVERILKENTEKMEEQRRRMVKENEEMMEEQRRRMQVERERLVEKVKVKLEAAGGQ